MQVKDYTLIEKIGQGGTADIWKAIAANGQTYALKQISRQKSDKLGVNFESFQLEGQLLNQLECSYFPKLKEQFIWEDSVCIVMEFIVGQTLEKWLSQQVTAKQVELLLDQLMRAIDVLHSHGIFHADIKPQNIIVTHHGLKVVDFGNSQRNDAMGTKGFAAPEQYEKSAQKASDVYAFGRIIHYCHVAQPLNKFWQSLIDKCCAPEISLRPVIREVCLYRRMEKLKKRLKRSVFICVIPGWMVLFAQWQPLNKHEEEWRIMSDYLNRYFLSSNELDHLEGLVLKHKKTLQEGGTWTQVLFDLGLLHYFGNKDSSFYKKVTQAKLYFEKVQNMHFLAQFYYQLMLFYEQIMQEERVSNDAIQQAILVVHRFYIFANDEEKYEFYYSVIQLLAMQTNFMWVQLPIEEIVSYMRDMQVSEQSIFNDVSSYLDVIEQAYKRMIKKGE